MTRKAIKLCDRSPKRSGIASSPAKRAQFKAIGLYLENRQTSRFEIPVTQNAQPANGPPTNGLTRLPSPRCYPSSTSRRGYSLVVELQPSKLVASVRFRLPAPFRSSRDPRAKHIRSLPLRGPLCPGSRYESAIFLLAASHRGEAETRSRALRHQLRTKRIHIPPRHCC